MNWMRWASLDYLSAKSVMMQLGSYTPQCHPNRRVIETPGRYACLFPAAFLVLTVSRVPAQDIHGALRS